MSTPQTRLAEPLGALSLAMDLAVGLPPESALASTVLAVRAADLCGLSANEQAATYYATITRFLGCTSTAMEGAALALGEDQELNRALTACDWTDPDQVQEALRIHVASDTPNLDRERAFQAIRESHDSIPAVAALHCAQAVVLGSRLPLPDGTLQILGHMYDRWDGTVPGARGGDIPAPARIIPIAVCAELFRRIGGTATAMDVLRSRAGGAFDPDLCRLFEDRATSLFEGFGTGNHWENFLGSEPGVPCALDPASTLSVAEVFGDFVDAKSPWMLGHSARVAELASTAASELGLGSSCASMVRVAGMVHDIGRAAIPNKMWDKPGPLTHLERKQVETHTYHTHATLLRSEVFRFVAESASGVHERGDGSGYHRRVRIDDLPTMLLAAADMYDALTHERPWRTAHGSDVAERILVQEVAQSRFSPRVVDAVLGTAGHRARPAENSLPAGITPRELDVLRLLAAGCSDKAIASRLGISVKTAGHHVSSVCRKTGAHGRAQVAIFALENRALIS